MNKFKPCLLLAYKLIDNPQTQERITALVKAYEKGWITDVYITTSYKEMDSKIGIKRHIGVDLVQYLKNKTSIPTDKIHFFPYGQNTAGEIEGFVRCLPKQGHKLSETTVYLCTSYYHMDRAEMLLRKQRDEQGDKVFGIALSAGNSLDSFELSLFRLETLKMLKDFFFWEKFKKVKEEDPEEILAKYASI